MIMSQAFIAKFTYLFLCLREITHFFFGVAIRLYLLIDVSLSSDQHMCKVLCLQSEIASNQIGAEDVENKPSQVKPKF